MNVDGYKGKGKPKKAWMDFLKENTLKKGINSYMISD